MADFNEEAFAELVDSYAASVERIRSEELYKWEATQCFQQHWDPDAEDFVAMLEASFSKAGNLLSGWNYLPRNMLLDFATADPQGVRAALLDLLNGTGDLASRMVAFSQAMDRQLAAKNQQIEAEGGKTIQNTYQDARAMCVYLSFVHPERYYLYKSEMFLKFAKLVDFECAKGKYEKPVACHELLDALLAWVEENRPDVIEQSDSLLPPDLREIDSAHHIFMQDIMFFAAETKGQEKPLQKTESAKGVDSVNGSAGDAVSEKGSAEGLGEELGQCAEHNYWLLVANPKIWSFAEIAVGGEQSYTLRNENGNLRRIQKNYLNAKSGDWVIGYESAPRKKVVSLCKICRDHDGQRMYFAKVRDYANPVTYEEMKDNSELAEMEFLKNPNGSFFKLTREEFEAIEQLAEEETSPLVAQESAPYSDADFLGEVYLGASDLANLKELLRRKKNLILQGAPGTGKTFAARRLAYAYMGCKDDSRIQQVQFHQGTAYDDVVYGYRPNDVGGFDPTPGVFVSFCRRAAQRPDDPFFFIVDEINRANISKVFGELLMLVEADHRGDEVTLTVSGERFFVPENVYLIGMMNTADRGLALIDYALRRRFAFFEMEPALCHPAFLSDVQARGEKLERLVHAVANLNNEIVKDPALGRGFRIGHSYFCVGDDAPEDVAASIVEYELVPLIEEYWFDDDAKVAVERKRLEGAVK